jgi:hypothetical protein
MSTDCYRRVWQYFLVRCQYIAFGYRVRKPFTGSPLVT